MISYVTLMSKPRMLLKVTSRLLGDYIRNEEAINSTPNRTSSLKVVHFLLYRRSNIPYNIYFFISYSMDDLFPN